MTMVIKLSFQAEKLEFQQLIDGEEKTRLLKKAIRRDHEEALREFIAKDASVKKVSRRELGISIAKKLSNGFIRAGHDVLNLSDRDTIRYNRVFHDVKGHKYLNKQIVE